MWFERVMALIALINLGLVMFDFSYVTWRDWYLRYVPEFTQWYGEQFKGMEPHRSTEAYLETVTELENQLERTGQVGLQLPETAALLEELRTRSDEMIDENPFQGADKSGTLERIKNRVRDRIGDDSAKQAFNTFWSEAYISQEGWPQTLEFFNTEIEPLIATNYFRGIGEDGRPTDQFWLIDQWFMLLFVSEFLLRTFYLSLRYKGTNWFDAMLWRWFDVFLWIPISAVFPIWRWLRVIPVTIRVNRSRLINLNPIQVRITRSLVASFAIELTEIVVLRIINQMQNLIRQGDIARMLLQADSSSRYIDINGVDEVEVISQRLMQVLLYQVLPKIKPDIDALLRHSVTQVVSQSPVYAGVQRLPGLNNLPDQLIEQLVSDLSQNTYDAIIAALEDPVGAELTKNLVTSLGKVFRTEVQQEKTVEEIQLLLAVMLDEIKINYIRRIAEEDVEALREQTQELYGMIQSNEQAPQRTTGELMR